MRRVKEHNRKKGKFTDAGIPWVIVHTEYFNSKEEAIRRERFIKSRKSKQFIQEIIKQR
jgi:putative endonuclease